MPFVKFGLLEPMGPRAQKGQGFWVLGHTKCSKSFSSGKGTVFFFPRKSSWPIHSFKTLKFVFFFPAKREKKYNLFFFFPRKSSFAIHSKSGGVSIILLKSKLCFFFPHFWVFFLFFFFSWKSSHVHSFIRSQCCFFFFRHWKKKKNSFFIHSIDFCRKCVKYELCREKKKYGTFGNMKLKNSEPKPAMSGSQDPTSDPRSDNRRRIPGSEVGSKIRS